MKRPKSVRDPGTVRRRAVAALYWVTALLVPAVGALSFWEWESADVSFYLRVAAAVLTAISLVLKGIGDWMARQQVRSLEAARAEEERRVSVILSDLADTLGESAQAEDSREREKQCVLAAENVVGSLLAPKASEVRSCFYRLQWKDEPVGPHQNPEANAFLQRVTSARGRGVDKPRDQFTFAEDDPEGAETLRQILDNRPVGETDTSPHLTGKSYGSFLSVPVHYCGEIVGMITADSPDVGAIDLQCEHLLRTVGAFAALGLNAESLTVDEGLGPGTGVLLPGLHTLWDLFDHPDGEEADDDHRP